MASQLRWTSKSVDLLQDADSQSETCQRAAQSMSGRGFLLGGEQQDLESRSHYRALREGGVYLGH
jgi:hypothetical protein